jgi:cysteinyl-tRNA synthetase
MLQLDGVKMSKSLGNLVLARVLLQSYEADHLRMYLLSYQLRESANFVEGDLEKILGRYERLKGAATSEAAGAAIPADSPLKREFEAAMDEDFRVPAALQVLDAAAGRLNAGRAEPGDASTLRASLATLGFAFAGSRGPANGDLTP